MDKNKGLAEFLKKVSGVFTVLEVKEGKDEIAKNLISSFFINFSRLLATDENISPLLNDFSQSTDNNDSGRLFNFLDSKNVNYQDLLNSAQRETLQSFVSELGQSITLGKVEELNKIISE